MNEAQKLQQLAGEYFEATYRAMPTAATLLGIHKYDNTLGDFSAGSIQDYLARLKQFLPRFQSIDAQALPIREQIDLATIISGIETYLVNQDKIGYWRRNPGDYISWPMNGLFILTVRDFAPLEERTANLASRLKEFPAVLREGKANVTNPAPVFVEVAAESAEGAIEFLETTVPALAEQVPSLKTELLDANSAAIDACRDYVTYLRNDLLPRAKGDFAIGRELFAEKLRVEHMLSMSPEEMVEIGRQLFDDTKRELEQAARSIDPTTPWATMVERAHANHPPADRLVSSFRDELDGLKRFLVEREIVTIPANEVLEVTDTPTFERSTIPYLAYLPPAPFEQSQMGSFWVTPVNPTDPPERQEAQLREHSVYSITLGAVHEAVPGHHLQLVWSNNSSSQIRKHADSTLFAEGWALYCEQLMDDVGYYSDPLHHITRLEHQLWRAARVIIDVGLHVQDMTIPEAVNLLTSEVHLSQGGAQVEVNRYAESPTQPMSYLIGKREIMRLREEVKSAMGPKFSLKTFHDTMLSCGTIPISFIRRQMASDLGINLA